MFAFETDYYACQHYLLLQQMQVSPYPVLAFPQLSPQQFHPTSTNQLFFTHSFQNYTNPLPDRPDSP